MIVNACMYLMKLVYQYWTYGEVNYSASRTLHRSFGSHTMNRDTDWGIALREEQPLSAEPKMGCDKLRLLELHLRAIDIPSHRSSSLEL